MEETIKVEETVEVTPGEQVVVPAVEVVPAPIEEAPVAPAPADVPVIEPEVSVPDTSATV